MSTFQLKISSPDGNIFDEQVSGFSVRGAEGDLAVLAGHIPLVTTVKACDCTITLEDGNEKAGHTEGGLLDVSGTEATLFSWNFEWKE